MAAYTTIDNPELFFQIKLYTGNGTDDTAITLDGDENMQPDAVWVKTRSTNNNHFIYDSVRGVTKSLIPNHTNTEATTSGVKSFDSDGFTLGDSNGNANTETYVAWCWKESATAGFDIVSYTGNLTNRTMSHSLSAVPKMIIIKNRNTSHWWHTYHHKIGNNYEVYLNATNAKGSTGAYQSTDPTSSVFSLGGSGYDGVNGSGNSLIAYCFAEKQGFSKFGSFEGNSNADGTYVHLGFRPALVCIKSSSATSAWYMYDNKRLGYNVDNNEIYASSDHAEQTDDRIDLLSNGFKMRTSDSTLNGGSLIYLAFAEAPFVNSNGVPCNAR